MNLVILVFIHAFSIAVALPQGFRFRSFVNAIALINLKISRVITVHAECTYMYLNKFYLCMELSPS